MKEPKQFIITEVPGLRIAVGRIVNSGIGLALWSHRHPGGEGRVGGVWVLSFQSREPGVSFSDRIRQG